MKTVVILDRSLALRERRTSEMEVASFAMTDATYEMLTELAEHLNRPLGEIISKGVKLQAEQHGYSGDV